MTVPPVRPRDPQTEILAANPWYVEDQFGVQLGASASRAVVENRWRVFAAAIDDWQTRWGAPPARILDAGCGDGINLAFLTRFCAERRWPTTIVGADYNMLRVGRAQSLVRGLVRASVVDLAFADESFDVILCNQVLEHVPQYRTALKELRRALRPGGLLIVGVPNEGSWLGQLRNHVLQRSILATTDHVNMFTARRLKSAFAAADLRFVQLATENFFTPHTTLHGWLNRSAPTRRCLNVLGRMIPSTAAGLLATVERPR